MDARRLRFGVALLVFLLWVAALGVMAVRSGYRPVAHPRDAPARMTRPLDSPKRPYS